MPFKRTDANALLVSCHRRCCVCHRFCGFKMELHHIEPLSVSQDDSIENAIPLCFECHAEVQLYNDQHARGRKFHPEELRAHKKQWLDICHDQPSTAFSTAREVDGEVGPLQSLVDEIEFNLTVAKHSTSGEFGCPFRDEQFKRAIHTGSISLLDQIIKTAINDAYVALGRANVMTVALATKRAGGTSQREGYTVQNAPGSNVAEAIRLCSDRLQQAHKQLLKLLENETSD